MLQESFKELMCLICKAALGLCSNLCSKFMSIYTEVLQGSLCHFFISREMELLFGVGHKPVPVDINECV